MTTHLEHGPGSLSNSISTLSRFPASRASPSLLSIIHSAMDAVVVVDARHQIVLVNHKVERMFGYPADHLLEKPLDVLLPSKTAGEQRRRIDRLMAGRPNGRRSKLGLKFLHANGEQLSLRTGVTRISVHGEHYLALILEELAIEPEAKNRARPVRPADLRKWATSSQLASEVEKRRFSKKLYDDIGQRLSVLKLDLDWLENSLPHNPEGFPERVAQMQGLLDHVISLTKNVASALRPPLLDDFGLLPAVEWLADGFGKKTGIRCEVDSNCVALRLGDPVESAIFRLVQEGLANVEKHSHAGSVRVTLTLGDKQLDVMIRDDGIGMPEGYENKTGCYGLTAMQERVFVLGGTITIKNTKPHGALVHASIPVQATAHAKPYLPSQ